MPVREPRFSDKTATERIRYAFNYSSVLRPGEGITGATFTSTAVTGVDIDSQDMISGSAVINAPVVEQLLIGGLPGVTYAITSTVFTSLPQRFEESVLLRVST